eukprot:scaffold101188_cov67-Phaeocystis_antarctica.AAC.5
MEEGPGAPLRGRAVVAVGSEGERDHCGEARQKDAENRAPAPEPAGRAVRGGVCREREHHQGEDSEIQVASDGVLGMPVRAGVRAEAVSCWRAHSAGDGGRWVEIAEWGRRHRKGNVGWAGQRCAKTRCSPPRSRHALGSCSAPAEARATVMRGGARRAVFVVLLLVRSSVSPGRASTHQTLATRRRGPPSSHQSCVAETSIVARGHRLPRCAEARPMAARRGLPSTRWLGAW